MLADIKLIIIYSQQIQVFQFMSLLRALISLATVSGLQQNVNQLLNNWVCLTYQLKMMDRLGRVTILHIAILKAMNLNSTMGQTLAHVPRVTNVYVWQVTKLIFVSNIFACGAY